MFDFNNNAAVFGKKDIVITPTLEETSQGLAATVILENIGHYMEKTDDYTLEVLRNKKSYEDAHFGTRLFEPGQFFRLSFYDRRKPEHSHRAVVNSQRTEVRNQ